MANRLRKSAAVAALAVATIGGNEGLQTVAYPDPASKGNPWTICYGHTGKDVTPDMKASFAECKELLLKDMDKEADGIEKCVKVDLPDRRYVALLDLAHNIGVGGVCRSKIVVLLNAGLTEAACDRFLKYNTAFGIPMRGLTSRRQRNRAQCLADL